MRDEPEYASADSEHRAYARAEAIAHCGLCDDEGMRGLHRCEHGTDYAAVAQMWAPRIREILAKKGGKR